MRNAERIVLVGFMGTGKSTVGRRLARALTWDFVDTDAEIEQITGQTVAEIFRRHGETRFRSEENLLVKRLGNAQCCVIATGGGTVLNPENWELLRRDALSIHLYAPVDVILERVWNRSERPLLRGNQEEIEALWQQRLPIYRQADWTIDTTIIDVEQVEHEILARIERWQENESGNLAKDRG